MAIQPARIQRQMIQTQEADDSGSKWGSLLGALGAGALTAGAIAAAPATGGASLAAPAAAGLTASSIAPILGAAGGGMALGGMFGGFADKKAKYESKNVVSGSPQPTGEGSAMSRRLAEKSQSDLRALMQAESALAKAPPHIQQEYAEPIQTARILAQKKYGVA